jgi:hypothetical protein
MKHAPDIRPVAAVSDRRSPAALHCRPLVVALAACLCSCASTPRVGEVDGTQFTETISKANQTLFINDRASHLRVQSDPLPPAQQREEYYVTWRGAGIQLVKFEYRQVNVPDKIQVQTASATNRHSTVFTVAGDDFHNGGPISAWRVSLWDGDRLLAERKSVLW